MNARESLRSFHSPSLSTGVLTNEELLLGGMVAGKPVMHSRWLPSEAQGLSGLLEYLWQQEVTTVWVLPTATLSQRVTCDALQHVQGHWTALIHPSPMLPDRPACVRFLPVGQRGGITLAFPEHAGWNWTLPDALTLLATAIYLDQVLAQHVVEAPQVCAQELLTTLTLNEPVAQMRASPVDLWTLPDQQGCPVPFLEGVAEPAWMRPLTLEEQRLRYLHKYIAVSRALQACLGVPLGAGAPQVSPNGRACDGIHPGIWRVQVDRAGSLFDDKKLPGYLSQQWLSTPLVTCCRTIGYGVQVQEGYFWPHSHQVLKPWATFLWQALQRLHSQPHHFRHAQARANACQTITRLIEQSLAMLYLPSEEGGWSRPDWWAQLQGRRTALLFRDLVQLVKQGSMPVLLSGDAFWVISRDPNPLTAVPGLFSNQRWKGFALGYSVPLVLTKEVQALFRGQEPVHQVVWQLDRLAGEQVCS